MKQFIREKRINLIHAVIGATIAMLLPIGLDYWVLKATPRASYFNYESIEPAKAQYDLGEKPRLFSFADINKELSMEWKDVLRCTGPDHEDYTFFSSYPSESDSVAPRESEERKAGWIYQGAVPTHYEADCYVVSTITARLPYNINKRQTIESSPFEFVEPQPTIIEVIELPTN